MSLRNRLNSNEMSEAAAEKGGHTNVPARQSDYGGRPGKSSRRPRASKLSARVAK